MSNKASINAVSIILPMYNEAGNVIPLLTEIHQTLSSHMTFELIAVDDGSRDTTLNELKQAKPMIPNLSILKHPRNLGQSVGVMTGVRAARYPWIVTLDGDGQNDPKDILKLLKAAEESLLTHDKILVTGHRTHRKDTGWKRFGSRFANAIRQKLLNDNCPDSGCGLKLFERELFLRLPHFNHLHRFLPALFKRAGAEIINVPISHRPRIRGVSKYGNWSRLKVGIVDLLGVAWLIRRPCMSITEEQEHV